MIIDGRRRVNQRSVWRIDPNFTTSELFTRASGFQCGSNAMVHARLNPVPCCLARQTAMPIMDMDGEIPVAAQFADDL